MLLLERSASAMCSAQASGAVRFIERFLWGKGQRAAGAVGRAAEPSGCRIWDGNDLEKAESEKVQGLCAVRSSKAKRLRKLKPGLFNQLSGPAARGEGHGMDRGRAGRTQADSDRCDHARGGVGKVSTRPPNGR